MSTVLSYADMASKTSNANPLSLKQQKELEFPIRISHQNVLYYCKQIDAEPNYKKIISSNGDEVILYSPDFGTGWSTFMKELPVNIQNQMIYDSRIIRFIEDKSCLPEYRFLLDGLKYLSEEEYESLYYDFMAKILGLPEKYITCSKGFCTLKIFVVPKGKKYTIHQHNGYEYVVVHN